jgi:hypothetical protein
VDERSIGAMPWVSVAGPRAECFRALGRHAAQAISSIVDSLPQLEALRRQVATAGGRSRFEAVVAATAARFPTHMDEMTALAEGAGVGVGTVLLLNLRGDLGDPQAGGCSDVAVPGEGWVLGHNEDGDPQFAPVLSGLTLHVDGDPPAFALWYPGMLPSNAFTLNGGLAWGIDHIPAVASTVGPARHVVARALQCLQELEAAIDFLASVPSAGGFAYNFVEPSTGRVATVEAGGGAGARPQVPGAAPILWHTNHVRYTAASGAAPGRSSCARGEVLAAVAERDGGPPVDRDAILEVLTTPLPDGVRAEGQSVTLCTVVADGPSRAITFVPRGGEPVHVPIDELLR